MKLFTVTHKAVARLPVGRTLIGVGPDRNIVGVELYDDAGENISQKNANYCELTALYWIWKNCDEDVVGLEHYRRFFCRKTLFRARPLSAARIGKILGKYDAIVSVYARSRVSVGEYYRREHIGDDLKICRDVVREICPEYAEDFDGVMNSRRAVMCNMTVMPKALFDEYCAWLFGILFLAEKRIDLTGRDVYQKRVFGFLSERLFNVWLRHNNLKLFHAPVYGADERPVLRPFRALGRRIKKLFDRKNRGNGK